MPSFVPAEKSETPEAASQQRGVSALLGDPKRGGEGAVGGVEPFEQRREVALPKIDLGESGGAPVARKVRDQRVDDLPLACAKTQRLADTLLLEQQVCGEIECRLPEPAGPFEGLIEGDQRIGELAQLRSRAPRLDGRSGSRPASLRRG